MNNIVIGWRTPDAKYSALARSLSMQLGAVGQVHRFYVKPKAEDWQRTIVDVRPRLTLEAMNDHPDHQILFLDVDAIVRGPVAPLFQRLDHCDVAFSFRNKDLGGKPKARLHPIGGVFLVNPTDRAREFCEAWVRLSQSSRTEEVAIAHLVARDGVNVSMGVIPPQYGCYEVERAPLDAVIVHKSAHARSLPFMKRAEQGVRRLIRSVRPKRVEATS